MSSQSRNDRNHRGKIAGLAVLSLLFLAAPSFAIRTTCAAPTVATLQSCINTSALNTDASKQDTLIVNVTGKLYQGQQIRINNRKNLWIIGDTSASATDSTRPRILYQDVVHWYTDLDPGMRADTTPANTFGQNNGAVWINQSDNIRLEGIVVDGNSALGATKDRIFAYPATLGKGGTVEVRGNVGVNILLSRNVQLRYVSITNAWYGVSVLSPNLGGAYSFPDPNDPVESVVATLPTSQAGKYGNHLIERCRIFDNVTGVFFWRDWDLSSVVRNNLFWGNYLRHWADPKYKGSDYISNLYNIDNTPWFNGKKDNLKYTTVGGAIYTTDAALTPYRIHNNTFFNNSTTFGAHYKGGTQHLFYNNLIGRPYQFFRLAADLAGAITQTERQTEMLQYFSEHQRANRVVTQDGLPGADTARLNPLHIWNKDSANLRLFRMRMIKTPNGNWPNGRSWSNDPNICDSLPMTWIPDTATGLTPLQTLSDTGGVVKWIRHNMWAGTVPDIQDGKTGADWSPPYLPLGVKRFIRPGVDSVFRDVSSFDIRWTLGMPLDTSSVMSPTWLAPSASEKLRILGGGWTSYEGTGKGSTTVGALDATGKWAAPSRRLVLRDTLIESIKGGMVKFNLNVSGEGIKNDDITELKVYSAKFYNDVPVADTIFNQGILKGSTVTVTRPNSILSRTAWPSPYGFATTDWNRATYKVDDSLTKGKLRPDHTFVGQIANPAKWLHPDSLYARAEVVLQAKLADGSIVYSNPGVFMFSRPRFQFDVTVLDATTGLPLPVSDDSLFLVAQARQPLKVVIKSKTVAKLPVSFKGYANLQMGNAGLLHGTDGQQLQNLSMGAWNVRVPNDTVVPYFDTSKTVFDTLRALMSPSNGTLIYRAVFVDSLGGLLPYFIEGRSQPIKVVSGAIYQVTIDSIYRDSTVIVTPAYKLKMYANENLKGRRDTLLTDGKTSSSNLANVIKGDSLRVVLQVRDKFGYEVRDSSSLEKGLYIRLAHVLAPGRFVNVATDPAMVTIDSVGTALRSVRLSFDSLGRAYATIRVSSFANPSTYAALRAAIVDTFGREIGTPGSVRDSGVSDTAWLKTDKAPIGIQWADSNGQTFQPITAGWVGEWYPVRLKMVKNRKGSPYTGSVSASSLSPLAFHPARGDTSRVKNMVFTGDSLSAVVWIRASDSVSGAWIKAVADSLVDSVGNLNFRYPQVASASFHDHDCDGAIDSLVIRMTGPLAFRPPSGIVAGDSLDAEFPHQFLSLSAYGAAERAYVYSDSVLAFAWTPGSIGAADASADRITIGNPLVGGKVIKYALSNLEDKAPPVAIKAFDQQSWNSGITDSLVVKFSEGIQISAFGKGATPPFAIVRGGTRISLDAVKLSRAAALTDSGTYSFVFTGTAPLVQSGDSLVIDGTSVSDFAGNLSGTTCPNKTIPIAFYPRYIPTQGYVIDVDGDGNADSVHLGFKDSLGSLPEKIFVQWGMQPEELTVTKEQLLALGVKTSDSAFTVPTFGWVGKTIIIDGDTLRNVPRTVGPKDSAQFEDGLSWEWLADRVPPVLIHARIRWDNTSTTDKLLDTLTVDFSEKVDGCGVGSDPALCLSSNGVKSDLKFSVGSAILSTVGARWTILVPRTETSIAPGDSVRATPGSESGLLVDLSNQNVPGKNSPYAYVYGDPAPPREGMMLDRNGDGRVDAVVLHYTFAPTVSKLPAFTFEWGDSAGTSVLLRSDSAYSVDAKTWIAVLNTPGAFGATGYGPAGSKRIGTQLSQTMRYGFPVRDSAGAVLKPRADLGASSAQDGYDTVTVWPSEPLRDPIGSVLLEFRRNEAVISADSVRVKSATLQGNGSWKVVIGPGSAYRPSPGDQARLSTSGSVHDTTVQSNRPHPDHAWVTLAGSLRVPYAAAYQDGDKDGRIELAVFDFASPVIPGTRIRVYDPAGGTTYREYLVSADDAGKTHIEYSFANNPWGQDVTSLVKPDLGLLLPPTTLDSNVYKGGKFNILDRVEPVVSACKLRYTSDTSSVDTLTCTVSEWVSMDATKLPLRYRRSGDPSDSGIAVLSDSRYRIVYDSVKKSVKILLEPFPADFENPASGDNIRLSWSGVVDAHGNVPGAEAKWIEVDANQRVFPPSIEHTNPIVYDPTHVAGDRIPGNQFEIVARPSSPTGDSLWSVSTGANWTRGENHYTPGLGSNRSKPGDALGTVVFLQTNVPVTIKLYLYDNLGTYVGTITKEITQEMLDNLPKSRIGLSDVGVLWKGQREDGRLVASGVYPIRMMAMRKPVDQEKADGKVNNYIYNKLVKVGVHLRLED